MILTVASFKGGCAKTTTAVHLAAYLAERGPTVLVDGDPNRSTLAWARRGALPFEVVDERQATKSVRAAEHVVIDTPARPSREDLEALAGGCDMLVIPSSPDALGLHALMATVGELKSIGAERFRVMLAIVPPYPSKDGDEARAMLTQAGLPVLAGQVRRAAAFHKAALAGVVVRDLKDPRAAECWNDYATIGRELMP